VRAAVFTPRTSYGAFTRLELFSKLLLAGGSKSIHSDGEGYRERKLVLFVLFE